jgi:hypothetical protein
MGLVLVTMVDVANRLTFSVSDPLIALVLAVAVATLVVELLTALPATLLGSSNVCRAVWKLCT